MKDFIFSDIKHQLLNHLNNKKPDPDHNYIPPVTAITLGNGVVMSVQASETHYCYPRINYGIWSSVEIYIDSKYYKKICDELLKYNEKEGDCKVMGYVPIDLVVAIIITSGGIKTYCETEE
jgi:hypothetical protein